MGTYEYSMNVFICCDLTGERKSILKNVILKIFKEKGNKSYSKFEQRDHDFDIYFSYNTPLENYKFYWIGHLFKNGISSKLFQSICKGIQKMNNIYNEENSHEIDIRRNNVILWFLKENEDSSMIENVIQTMNENSTLIKANNPIIITVGGKNIDKDYEKLKFINHLPGGNNDDIVRNVHSKLLTIDAYLNERGNIFDQIVYRNLGKTSKVTATTCLDILIYGGSRSGKSTFINILSNQLLAREQINAETCTTKCTEYIIPLEEKNDNYDIIQNIQGEINNELLQNQVLDNINQFIGKLKIIDTPGIIENKDVEKVCHCINNYIYKETEIIQLALFFMKDTTVLGKSKEILKILLKNNIPVFFVGTHSIFNENIKLEDSNIFQDIKSFIFNNFNEDARKLLIYKGENEIYNIIKINQKIDPEHNIVFGIDILLEKILHFFLFEKMDALLNKELENKQTFFQQKNILLSCHSDLSSNYLKFSLHDLLFRKFLTLADVSDYYYQKSIAIVTFANFECSASCWIPTPFIDLPIYYAIHYGMVMGILSVFGIKLNEVDIKTIIITNGTNLGGNYNVEKTLSQLLNIGIKIFLSTGKITSDVGSIIGTSIPFLSFLAIFGHLSDTAFSFIDTSVLGRNLITSCNKLPKNQQFFKNELTKFNYILSKIDEIRLRISNNHDN